MQRSEITVSNEKGFHIYPAKALSKELKNFQSDVELTFNGETVDARSPLAIMTLEIGYQDKIIFTAEGPDEEEAIAHIEQLFAEGYLDK